MAFDSEQVRQYWSLLEANELQLASGSWFGESDRVFRLGFGYLPIDELKIALETLEKVFHAVTKR